MDPYFEYYSRPSQAGSGLPIFVGTSQAGSGFFQDIFRQAVPIISKFIRPFAGRAVNIIANTAKDLISGRKRKASTAFKDNTKEEINKTIKQVISQASKTRTQKKRRKPTKDIFSK